MKSTQNFVLSAILFSLTSLIAIIGLSSCCDCRFSRRLEQPLVGTEWQLVQLMARDITPAADSYTLLFHSDGTMTGSGDCNRLTATYTATESRNLTIDNIGSTRRLCPNFETENEFVEVLDSATHYQMDANYMLLLSDGTLVAIFKAVPAAEE